MSVFVDLELTGAPGIVTLEYKDDGSVVTHDHTGQLEEQLSLAELGFEPPLWVAGYLVDRKFPLFVLMQLNVLYGQALDLWALDVVNKLHSYISSTINNSDDGVFKKYYNDAVSLALTNPNARGFKERRIDLSLALQLPRGDKPAPMVVSTLFTILRFIVGTIGSDSDSDELVDFYDDLMEDVAYVAGYSTDFPEETVVGIEMNRWMIADAVKRIKGSRK